MAKRKNKASEAPQTETPFENPDIADSPEQSVPSGEPKLVGRSHGYIIDDEGTPMGLPPTPAINWDEDWESGRHDAIQ